MSCDTMSLFVPHIFASFDKEFVAKAFSYVGMVERVDFVLKMGQHGKEYNSAYIHFSSWYENEFADRIKYDIYHEGKSKFYYQYDYYENGIYWIVLPNNAKKHASGDRKKCLDLGEAKSICAPTASVPHMGQINEEKSKALMNIIRQGKPEQNEEEKSYEQLFEIINALRNENTELKLEIQRLNAKSNLA